MSLRARLLLAFVLVAVPPVLALAWVVSRRAERTLEQQASARVAGALEAARRRLDALRAEARRELDALAAEALPALPESAAGPGLAGLLAARSGLDALELLDRDGTVVSSLHWPAGLGLPDRDPLLARDPPLRLETVARGYGSSRRLALMPERPALLGGRALTLRGGFFLDGDRLSALDAEIGLRDRAAPRWLAPAGSPLVDWPGSGPGRSAARGRVTLGGLPYSWAAAPLAPELWLVAASPRGGLETVQGGLRELTLGATAAALLAALAAALLLSARLARPLRELSDGVARVAAGDLSPGVREDAPGELGELARTFNSMTGALRVSRARLRQAERVAAWRELARRLAHELKNPLFPIQVSVETLRRAFERDGGADPGLAALVRDSSGTILEELRGLRAIVDEFSAFARMPAPELRPTRPAAVVEQVLALHRARAAHLELRAELPPELPSIRADPGQLARALGNLVANAIEAMPESGTLTVRAALAGEELILEVADTGPGLDAEQRARLFTPYYTTRPRGTGLGLAIVEGIVADHGGRVEVSSEPGLGSSFRLHLPVAGPQ